jgi:transposase-like protein
MSSYFENSCYSLNPASFSLASSTSAIPGSASWKKNWGEIATFFKYPPEVRTLIYTTNPIESLHRKIKKVSKNKSIFPNEQALFKLVYLAVEEASKK